jgi:hypothetical protein
MLSPEDMRRLAELDGRLNHLNAAEAEEWHRLRVAAIPRAVEPYYSLASPLAVPLYAGPLVLPTHDGGTPEQMDGAASFELAPRPRILVSGSVPRLLQIQSMLDGMPTPRLPTSSTVPDAPEHLPETGSTSWLGPVGGYVAGKAAAAKTVTFNLVNFVDIHGAGITDDRDVWWGRVVVNAGPWVVTIDARSNLREILATMRERGGYAVTHTCKLERRDGRSFGFARCQQLLTCLTWCLWFCRASAPAVILPVGFDKNDRAIWSRWAAPHTDPFPDTHWQWFDQAYGAEQLSMLLPLFFEKWSDPAWQTSLQRAIRYYADASVMGTLERNVVLAQVALESLAFAHLVRSSRQLQSSQFKSPVSKHIRHFLRDVGIPTTIPRTFYGLRKVRANSPWDGPAAIAWLRNDIVHAANRRVDRRRWRLWYQGWELSLWYLELAVLAVVKYEGRYRNRLSGEPDVGAVEPVPWASV